uniref:Amine oxidase domain-containing protein n=1 Tax=Strigamia maritima TaxID=126957 RepID=T1ISN8_STRMM
MTSKSLLTKKTVKIVVVGAGAAGLAAAGQLFKHGFTNVTVVEAQDRIGGRIYTEQLGDSHIELGAQWIHGEVGNPVHEIAVENNFLADSLNEPVTALDAEFRTQYGELLSRHLGRDFEIIMSSIAEECREAAATSSPIVSDTTLASFDKTALGFFSKKYEEYLKSDTDLPKAALVKDALFNWYCMFRNTIEGCDTLAEMSVKSWGDYKECDGNPVIDISTGYSSIVDNLASHIPNDTILLNKPVKNLYVPKLVENKLPEGKLPSAVVCLDGETIQSHHVICTVSLGYLKRYMNQFFYPLLPENKKHAITVMGFGAVNKIYMEFAKPFWPKDSAGFSFLWLDDTPAESKGGAKQTLADTWQKGIVGFYTVANQPNVLCGWLAGREARFMETLNKIEVEVACIELLKQFLNVDGLPKVVRLVRTCWNSQPYVLGSYSYKTYQCDDIPDVSSDLASPLTLNLDDRALGGMRTHPSLLFAGEATHPHYYSTVHGAILSGIREADRLASYYKAYSDEIADQQMVNEVYKDVVSSHRVIIIGAGIAGLSAAVALQDNSISDFKVLEALPRAGGRIESLKHGSHYIEYGAQWIHGEDGNPIFELALRNNLLSKDQSFSPEGDGWFLTETGDRVDPNIVNEVKAIMGQAYVDCTEFCSPDKFEFIPVSVGDYIREQFEMYLEDCSDSIEVLRLKRGIYDWHMNYTCIDNACENMNELSARLWGEYEECSGNPRINLQSGYASVIDLLLHQLYPDSITFNSAASKIYWDKGNLTSNLIHSFDAKTKTRKMSAMSVASFGQQRGPPPSSSNDCFMMTNSILGLKKTCRRPQTYPIEVTCENGKMYLCEHLILTQSVGCMKANFPTLFHPSLPLWKQNAILNTGYGTINKIFLEFAEPFWPKDCLGIQFVWTEHIFSLPPVTVGKEKHVPAEYWFRDLSGFDVVTGYNAMLLGWVGRKGAEAMEKYTNEQVEAVCVALLKIFTGISNIPDPVSFYRSNWHTNPYTKGSYSYRTVANEKENFTHKDLTESVNIVVDDLNYPALLFAGEATDNKYFSTVHGAYLSGKRAVTEIKTFYKELHKDVDDMSYLIEDSDEFFKDTDIKSKQKSLKEVKSRAEIKTKTKGH